MNENEILSNREKLWAELEAEHDKRLDTSDAAILSLEEKFKLLGLTPPPYLEILKNNKDSTARQKKALLEAKLDDLLEKQGLLMERR